MPKDFSHFIFSTVCSQHNDGGAMAWLFSPLSLSVTPQIVERIMLPASPTLPPCVSLDKDSSLLSLETARISRPRHLSTNQPQLTRNSGIIALSKRAELSRLRSRVITARAIVVWGQQTRLSALAPIQEFNVTPANNSVSLSWLAGHRPALSKSLASRNCELEARVGPICS